jgi:signal transduction histidine kinase
MVEAEDVEALRASCKRLVLAADADRRRIERELHGGVQQHLVALAVNLQLAVELADADPRATKTLLEELSRDVRQALEETAQLAQRIYPPVLAEGGLGAALRAAAVTAGVAASVDVELRVPVPVEVATTVYLCWIDAFERAARPEITLRDGEGTLAFVIRGDGTVSDGLRERVDALGGELTIRGASVCGSLPLAP